MTVVACVRNTFLDFAEAGEEGEEAQPRICKARTVSCAFRRLPGCCRDCGVLAFGTSHLEPLPRSAEESRPDQTDSIARPQPLPIVEDSAQEPIAAEPVALAARARRWADYTPTTTPHAEALGPPPPAERVVTAAGARRWADYTPTTTPHAEAEPASPAPGQCLWSQPPELGVQRRASALLEFVEEGDGEDEPQGPAASPRAPTLEELGRFGGRAAFQPGPVTVRGVAPQAVADASAARTEDEPRVWASDEATPRRAALGTKAEDRAPPPARAQPGGGQTTLMLRNLPNDYTRDMILELLDDAGFHGRYNFIHYPTDYVRNCGLGYAFVNMLSAADARQVGVALEGFRKWSVPSSKVCSIGWKVPCQGLEANIERYRNSPIMHRSVPDEYKPATFRDGRRVPFPRPTRKLRRPDGRWNGC